MLKLKAMVDQQLTRLDPAPSSPASLERALLWPLAAGAGHALLSLVLALGGERPSGPTPFGGSHFAAQALFASMLVPALWWILGTVAHGVSRLLGATRERSVTLVALAPAFAAPWLLTLVAPELLVYLVSGMGGLRSALRFLAPLTAVLELALCARALRRAHALSPARAGLAALAGLIAQALVGASVLR
jgi:hypothetical protein